MILTESLWSVAFLVPVIIRQHCSISSNKEILFCGCLVKSGNSRSLGNITDAVVGEWSQTIKKIINRNPEIKTVVPGHGSHGSIKLLYHTFDLVESTKLNPIKQ